MTNDGPYPADLFETDEAVTLATEIDRLTPEQLWFVGIPFFDLRKELPSRDQAEAGTEIIWRALSTGRGEQLAIRIEEAQSILRMISNPRTNPPEQ